MRDELKTLIGIVAFLLIFVGIILCGIDRFEKINNGEITVVSESYMDR